MTTLNIQSLVLYRAFLRGIRSVARGDKSKLINLRRSYRPQWEMELLRARQSDQGDQAVQAVEAKMNSTLSILESSQRLVTNLSSLSYHHHPHYLPLTSNASRLYSHTPKPIEWDPQDPGKAMKNHLKRVKDREEKGEGVLAQLAEKGLRGLRNRAEKDCGILLGRWEIKG